MVLAAGGENHRRHLRHHIPCRSVVNRFSSGRRVFAAQVCLWTARQVAVSSYRQIPLLLVSPFSGLPMDSEGNVARTTHLVDVRRMCGRVRGQGKGDGCHDDASSGPVRVDWLCLGVGSDA